MLKWELFLRLSCSICNTPKSPKGDLLIYRKFKALHGGFRVKNDFINTVVGKGVIYNKIEVIGYGYNI